MAQATTRRVPKRSNPSCFEKDCDRMPMRCNYHKFFIPYFSSTYILLELFWTCHQHWEHRGHGTHHQDRRHGDCHSHLGIWPITWHQPRSGRFLRCDCSSANTCHQGDLLLFPCGIYLMGISKIQSSGQRIEYFEKLQADCKISPACKIIMHSNIQWGSADEMLKHCLKLHAVSFISLW